MRMELAMNEAAAVDLLHGLVAIPSLSHAEAAASAWLVEQMTAAGYDRAYVDDAGNAVGELGPTDAARLLVLLGHIDTVPGNIPVRVEESDAGPVLYGRGSVDAKGPLATATAAVARLGSAWAHAHNVRLVVVGAVEEEAASSKGARFIRDRFDGVHEPIPDACIIGEPSAWHRVTLGYKGRVLVEMEASQPMAHTAGPDAGVATVAVDFWSWLSAYAAAFNQGRDKAFDQLLPSLRSLRTFTDDAMHDHVVANSGIRLPLDFAIDRFAEATLDWAASRVLADRQSPISQSLNLSISQSHPCRSPHHHHPPLQRLRTGLARRAQQSALPQLSGCIARRCACGKTGLRGQDRHQRHERRRPSLALPDPGLRPRRQQPGSHAPRTRGAGRVLARCARVGGGAACG
jgi:N-acetyl-ornithine/N-acetyl-lysine deacetylase